MKNFLSNMRSKLALLMVTLLSIAGLGAISAANSNLMEGYTRSLNVTRGQTQYQQTTNASDDEVVQVQVWLHNRENPAGERANNTVVRVAVPQNQPGANQNITGTITSDNFNTVTDTTTVVLDDATSAIEYIPGTAKYRYNKGAADGDQSCETGFDTPPERCYATVQISDSVIAGGVNLDTIRKTPLRGCNAHHETVTVQVRVKSNKKRAYSIEKTARLKGENREAWRENVNAAPGQNVEWKIEFKNNGTTQLEDVIILDQVPGGLKAIPGTVKLYNTSNPNGYTYPNSAVQANGSQVNVNVGTYNPGSNAIVTFETKMPSLTELECGTNKFLNLAYATPKGSGTVNDGATAKVEGDECEEPEKPSYVCESLTVEKIGGRKVRATVKAPAAGGAQFKHVVINFGDGSEPKTTTNLVNEHEYQADGTYKITAHVTFTVDGADKTVSSEACEAVVTFKDVPPTTPEVPELPKTGAGSVIGLFTVITSAAAVAHSAFSRRAVR